LEADATLGILALEAQFFDLCLCFAHLGIRAETGKEIPAKLHTADEVIGLRGELQVCFLPAVACEDGDVREIIRSRYTLEAREALFGTIELIEFRTCFEPAHDIFA